jgi:hypothetical protein
MRSWLTSAGDRGGRRSDTRCRETFGARGGEQACELTEIVASFLGIEGRG